MKRGQQLLWRLEAGLLRALIPLLRALGPRRASDLGGAVLRAFGVWLPASRIADRNLCLALPALDRAARRRVIAGVWDNLGRTIGEWPHIPALRRTVSGPGWEIENEAVLVRQAAQGGPAIFFSAHFGNWEMLPAVAAQYGLAISSVYRAAANPAVNALVAEMRERAIGRTVPMFPKGRTGARDALLHLARGGYLGLLVDQKLNDGIEVPFFGIPAMTAPALATLALRFRCPVIPGHVRRIGPARLRFVVEEPLPLPESGDRAADVAALTMAVNARLEHWIRADPDQWLWLHRRWPKPLYRQSRAGR